MVLNGIIVLVVLLNLWGLQVIGLIKEYDGLRSVWTNKNTQVRIGVGTFKHSTGISDSAYTHAIYTHFKRVPTVEEFLGCYYGSDGANEGTHRTKCREYY